MLNPNATAFMAAATRTTADGDSRSRVPSCGRRYADAPTAVLLTARGGGEFPPSRARQCPPLRARAGLRFIRRFSLCAANRRREHPNRTGGLDASSCWQTVLSVPPGGRDKISSAAPPRHAIDSLLGREQMRNIPPACRVQGTDECIDAKRCYFRSARSHCASRRR